MNKGKVLYASHVGVHVLRFVGEIRYPLAPTVERFVDNLFTGLRQAPFLIDLTKTETIDSTNLGLLARIALRMQQCNGPRVTIVSDRDDINILLESMGFHEVFEIQPPVGPAPGRGRVLPMEKADSLRVARTVLEAHRALMALNEHNQSLFRDVTAALEQAGAGGAPPV